MTFTRSLARAIFALILFAGISHAQSITASFETEPSTIYKGQSFNLVFMLTFTDTSLSKQMSLDALPEELLSIGKFEEYSPRSFTRDGKSYETRIYKARSTAVSEGDVLIEPRVQVITRTTVRTALGRTISERPVIIKPAAYHIKVLPLPKEDVPESFSGAVGNLSYSAYITPKQLATGEIAKVHFTIEGRDKLGDFVIPEIRTADNFKVYPAKQLREENPKKREYEQVLIPQHNGQSSVIFPEFCYFDPVSVALLLK